MHRKQMYTLINSVSNEVLVKTEIVQEDLTGVVDLGTKIFNTNTLDN